MKITDPSMLHFNESLKLMGFGDVSNISKSFLDYHNLILEWNSKINLISSNTVDSILERHFLDSMSVHLVDSLLNFDLMEDAIDVLDLGTGAGLPGVPLKISHPNWKLTLLDSTSKKVFPKLSKVHRRSFYKHWRNLQMFFSFIRQTFQNHSLYVCFYM